MTKPPAVSDGNVRVPRDSWHKLRRFTSARIGLGRAGGSIPTQELLDFQLAHARARDAVHGDLDASELKKKLDDREIDSRVLASAAGDRRTFVLRPDLGRILSDESSSMLQAAANGQTCDVVFVIADGLSSRAVERHALPVLDMVLGQLAHESLRIAPCCIVTQGRVAIGDEIGALLSARMSVVMIGERPGLSSFDSLGVYLTWDPMPGRSNAQRNCISNIRPEGLPYMPAAYKLLHLMNQARSRQLSGVALKEDAPLPSPVQLQKLFAATPVDRLS